MRIRKVGNSNVITLPRQLEQLGFTEGSEVAMVPLDNGAVVIMPQERLSAVLEVAIDEAIKKRKSTLDALDEYDRSQS